MRSRSNGGVIGAYALPTQNYANGVFFIHDAAIYNTGPNPIWPLGTGFIYSATGGTISTAVDNPNYKLHTFTANGTFTVVNGTAELEILLVGAGGSGGMLRNDFTSTVSRTNGGGGGGAVTLVRTFVNPGTVFTVEVGIGQSTLDFTAGTTDSISGKPSRVISTAGHNYVAYGGGSSLGYYRSSTSLYGRNPTSGGCGAGGSTAGNTSETYVLGTPSTAITPQIGNAGGNADLGLNTLDTQAGGGGGGAMGPGKPGLYGFNLSDSSRGGDGYLWSRTNCYYGAGGGGGRGALWSNRNLGSTGIRSKPGLCGPAATAATETAGSGGCSTIAGAGRIGLGLNGLSGYGGGAGGHCHQQVDSLSTDAITTGGSGTIIFCYRYQ